MGVFGRRVVRRGEAAVTVKVGRPYGNPCLRCRQITVVTGDMPEVLESKLALVASAGRHFERDKYSQEFWEERFVLGTSGAGK